MAEIPEFWRAEIWHPLSVHFPIALLVVAVLFKAIGLLSPARLWQDAGLVLLFLGVLAAWTSVYTGLKAEGEVVRTICNQLELKAHEENSYILSWIFTAGLALDVAYWKNLFNLKTKWLKLIIFLAMLTGGGFLVYTGHLGARLVYQQGAGVYHPSEDCVEFN